MGSTEASDVRSDDMGILDHPLSMVAVRYLCDEGGRASAESVRERCREVLCRIGWTRAQVDAEYMVQIRRLLRVGYILYSYGSNRAPARKAPKTGPLVYVVTNTGRNGASAGSASSPRKTWHAVCA